MKRWRKRIALAIVGFLTIAVIYTLLYQWGMSTFEGEERNLSNSLQVVIESLTTAGFGGDSHTWDSAPMNLIVIIMNLSGVLLVFMAVPLFVFPMLEQAMERSHPTETDLTDHVIICGYSRRDEVLTEELHSAGIDYLYIDSDPTVVDRLLEEGVEVMLGDTENVDTFVKANATEAAAVVADVDDEINPTIVLSAKRVNPDIHVVSVVRQTDVTPYHRLAGADEIVEAPQLLGESLGTRAVTSFAEKFRATVEVETDFSVTELLVAEDSDLAGQTLREATTLTEQGAIVFGGWFDGKFLISPGPETVIEPNSILLIGGEFDKIDDVKARPLPSHEGDPERVIVAGHGVVGSAVTETIEAGGLTATVVDIEPDERVDIIGDVTDPETLLATDLDDARAVVLALDKDTTTIFTTLVLSNLAPDLEIIARVHNTDNVWKVYNAGADFAMSMATISGKMLASILIEHREILIPQTEFEFVRTKAPALSGQTLEEAHIRRSTGCTVVAVERGGQLETELRPDFEIRSDDVLLVAGSHDDTAKLIEFVH